MTRIQNVTDASTVSLGSVDTAFHTSSFSSTRSMGEAVFEISATKTFELQHRCNVTKTTDGFGQAGGITNEVYSIINIIKLK